MSDSRCRRTLVALARVVACHGDGRVVGPVDPTPPSGSSGPGAATIVVTAPTSMVLLSQSLQLTAEAHRADGGVDPAVDVLWTSSDSSVLGVDAAGRVTERAVGTALIIATACDGQSGAIGLGVSRPAATLQIGDTVGARASTPCRAARSGGRSNSRCW